MGSLRSEIQIISPCSRRVQPHGCSCWCFWDRCCPTQVELHQQLEALEDGIEVWSLRSFGANKHNQPHGYQQLLVYQTLVVNFCCIAHISCLPPCRAPQQRWCRKVVSSNERLFTSHLLHDDVIMSEVHILIMQWVLIVISLNALLVQIMI